MLRKKRKHALEKEAERYGKEVKKLKKELSKVPVAHAPMDVLTPAVQIAHRVVTVSELLNDKDFVEESSRLLRLGEVNISFIL